MTLRLHGRPLRVALRPTYARPVSWSAQHDREQELEHQHRIEAPEPEPRDREQPLHQLAADVGNSAFGSTLARDGAGILPTGQVHPEVQGKIDSTRGGGAGLDDGVRGRFESTLGDLGDVRVHTDDTADALNQSVS